MRKVLVIDDDDVVARAIHRFLRQIVPKGWAVEHETGAALGLSRLVVDRDIQLVFVDSLMPEMHGDDLVEEALRKRPSMKGRIVVCSGAWYTDQRIARLFTTLGCQRLDKPFRLEELERIVNAAEGLPLVD